MSLINLYFSHPFLEANLFKSTKLGENEKITPQKYAYKFNFIRLRNHVKKLSSNIDLETFNWWSQKVLNFLRVSWVGLIIYQLLKWKNNEVVHITCKYQRGEIREKFPKIYCVLPKKQTNAL